MRAQRPPSPRQRSARRASVEAGERGQTTIDFAIGATLFLLVMAFVFIFVPVMFEPFTTSQSEPLVADRVANRLATDILGKPDQPYVLDEDCTASFFDAADPSAPAKCEHLDQFDDYGASLHPHLSLGVEQNTNINVTLVDPSGNVEEAVGTPRGGAVDVITAQRRVLYKDESYELFVRVW